MSCSPPGGSFEASEGDSAAVRLPPDEAGGCSASKPIPDAQAYLGGIVRMKVYELAKQGRIQIVKVGARSSVLRSRSTDTPTSSRHPELHPYAPHRRR